MFKDGKLYRMVGFVVLYWVASLIGDVEAEDDKRAKAKAVQKENDRLVDWDYAQLALIHGMPEQDIHNYYHLVHLRRERQERDMQNVNKSASREKYENDRFRKLYNAVFSTKSPHLRSSHENYIQFLKDEFFAKQRVPENPKTSRERYEWFLKKQKGSFFGGKYDFDTYLAGNFTARRRRRAVDVEDNNHQVANRRNRRHAARKKNVYQTPRVVDYMNERDLNNHYDDLAWAMRKRFTWDSKDVKPRAYYTSNESKKHKLYSYNERALLEKENAKKADEVNYEADEDYKNKPRAYYHKDEAKYINMPKKRYEKMLYEREHRGPKYHFRNIPFLNHDRKKRQATPEKPTTWMMVHLKPFTGPYRQNLSAEIIEQIAENKEHAVDKQKALEAAAEYKMKDHLEGRTTYRLSTYRNFVDEMKVFSPYTFPDNPLDKYPEIDDIKDIYLPDTHEVTTPKNYALWRDEQLAEYRKQYRGLTVREPFAHYGDYSWENIGFDMAKIPDPIPPIWPLEKAMFNAQAVSEFFGNHLTQTTPVVHDSNEWDSMGKEKGTLYVPPTKKFYMPGDP